MKLADLALVVGPVAGPLLAVPACVVIAVTKQARQVLIVAAALAVAVAASFVGYWFLWGKAFDSVDALQTVPRNVSFAQDVSLLVCAVATVSLVVLTAVTLVVSRRSSPRATMQR